MPSFQETITAQRQELLNKGFSEADLDRFFVDIDPSDQHNTKRTYDNLVKLTDSTFGFNAAAFMAEYNAGFTIVDFTTIFQTEVPADKRTAGYTYDTLHVLRDKGLKVQTIMALNGGLYLPAAIMLKISQAPTLVGQLNDFATIPDPVKKITGEFKKQIDNDGAAYDQRNHQIKVGSLALDKWQAGQVGAEAEILGMLAHELAHSREAANSLDVSNSYADYFDRSRRKEGAGFYWQYMTIKTIYNSGPEALYENINNLGYWEENSAESKPVNLYAKINEVIENYGESFDPGNPPPDLIYQIGVMGSQINHGHPDKITFPSEINLTYDEVRRWEWMSIHTDFAIDYLEARGITIARGEDGAGRREASELIRNNVTYCQDIKVLLNHYNNYLGNPADNSEDPLSAKENGSALGNAYGHEVLWGGGGIDTLTGGDNNDILLGGENGDYLNGGGGDDRLAGNNGEDWLLGGAGNDILYGGADNDILIGGSDDDHLYGGAVHDTYVLSSGRDVIYDSDKDGVLQYNGKVLGKASYLSPSPQAFN